MDPNFYDKYNLNILKYILIYREDVTDPNKSDDKLFRRRFWVSLIVFEYLVDLSKEYNLFGSTINSNVMIPVESYDTLL